MRARSNRSVNRGRGRRFLRAAIAVAAAAVAPHAGAVPQATVLNVHPENYAQRWDKGPWRAWALSGHTCLILYQEARHGTNNFWGFRQSPGSQVEFIVGGIGTVRPGAMEVTLDFGPPIKKTPSVERFGDYDGYVIPFQSDALSIFPDALAFSVYVDGNLVADSTVSHNMRDLEKLMGKCLDWQAAH